MKKLVAMAIIILSLAVGQVWATDATEAINPEAQPFIAYGKDGTGISKIRVGGDAIKSQIGSGQIFTGTCRLQKISMYSDTAGDNIGVYDTTNSAYPATSLELELGISANTSSASIDVGGAPFANGVRILASDGTNTLITIVYDY